MTAQGNAVSLVVQNLRPGKKNSGVQYDKQHSSNNYWIGLNNDITLHFPGTRYKFRVSAENRHGMSQESQAVTTRMMEEGKII